MTTSETVKELSERDREILKDVIGTFVLTGDPVSSRSVAKHRRHGLSAATIRNVMADLEEQGLLSQPHTSAGRVPTGEGYHLYIESLMPRAALPEDEKRYIDASLPGGSPEGERLMSSASHVLSELSDKIGIVMTPAIGKTVLKAISFVKLSGCRVLCVVVSGSGFVDNKVIETTEPIDRDELIRISNYLTDNFHGFSLIEIRERLLALMAEERVKVDLLLARSIDLARGALSDQHGPELLVEGTNAVLRMPELADLERVKKLLDKFADTIGIVQILSQVNTGRGVRVLIGDESDLTSDLDFSLVTTGYGVPGRTLGSLGVFGPSRMEYPKVIPLVHYLGERLSQALETVYGEDLEA